MKDVKKINQVESQRINDVFKMVSKQEVPEHDCHRSPEDGCDCDRLYDAKQENPDLIIV